MTRPDELLLCFAVGSLWSVASLTLGGLHLGHGHSGGGHAHAQGSPSHASAGHASASHASSSHAHSGHANWLGSLVHPSSLAAFLAWFGGVGYLLTRHTGWRFWADITVALAAGLAGASVLGSFLRFLQAREQALDPTDYEMTGVLGRVSCPIRTDGVGEVIYLRDGARRPVPARSQNGSAISRDEEVIVMRYERGIAYVQTWAAMVSQSPAAGAAEKTVQEENNRVE